MNPTRTTFIALVLIATPFLGFAGDEVEKPTPLGEKDLQQLIFHSVLEGLYSDGVGNDDVDIILRRDPEQGYVHFIYGCPICMPAIDALLVYRGRAKFYARKKESDTFGDGLDKFTRERLRSREDKERLDAINGMVTRWVERRMKMMRLEPGERKAWEELVAQGRKKGMEALRSMQKVNQAGAHQKLSNCAICEAAYGAARR